MSHKDFEFTPIEEALQAYQNGEILILVDDEDRENEGDFVMAAEKVTPEWPKTPRCTERPLR